jgi:hypothetical protein
MWPSAGGGDGGEGQLPSALPEVPNYTQRMNVKFCVTLSFRKDISVIRKCTVTIYRHTKFHMARWLPS